MRIMIKTVRHVYLFNYYTKPHLQIENQAIFIYWPKKIKTFLLIFKLILVVDGILHVILK